MQSGVSGSTSTVMKNLFTDIPEDLPDELLESLVNTDSVHIQRIVSKGHATPEQGWYDQQTNEFVILLKGAARLEYEDGRVVSLNPGDWLQIPAHTKHRVAWTEKTMETVWLAVHYS